MPFEKVYIAILMPIVKFLHLWICLQCLNPYQNKTYSYYLEMQKITLNCYITSCHA